MKKGLFIGRFQPFHKAHKKVIMDLAKKVDYLIIGIGSSNKHHTFDNPFTLKERTDMINDSLEIKNYSIKPIPDLDDYSKWAKHVATIIGGIDIVFTGNKLVKELFEKENINVETITHSSYISGTLVRDMVAKSQKWEKYVTKKTANVVKKVGGLERIQSLSKIYKNPVPTVDIIIETDKGILLIERKHEPFGWALPGGHVDYGESLEDAAIREAKEETSLDIEIIEQFHTYSNPKRDPRAHKISTVYIANAKGKAKANDDAKNVGIFTKDNLPELVFDHKRILEDYLRREK